MSADFTQINHMFKTNTQLFAGVDPAPQVALL
jgi:hypothetical protein